MYRLTETPTVVKVGLLSSLHLYSLALSIAPPLSHPQIHKSFGDYLYARADYEACISHFIHTIGYLEPSYIIRKFLDVQRVKELTDYLTALHERKLATREHTTLLMNCWVRRGERHRVQEFLDGGQGDDLNFDIETAVRVCRHAKYFDEALKLSRKFDDVEGQIEILVEDMKKYKEVVALLVRLESPAQIRVLKEYGAELIEKLPEDVTNVLVDLCVYDRRVNPQDFLHLFVSNNELCISFLDRVFQELTIKSSSPKHKIHNTEHLEIDGSVQMLSVDLTYSDSGEESDAIQKVCETLLELYLSEATALDGDDNDELLSKSGTLDMRVGIKKIQSGRNEAKALELLKNANVRICVVWGVGCAYIDLIYVFRLFTIRIML